MSEVWNSDNVSCQNFLRKSRHLSIIDQIEERKNRVLVKKKCEANKTILKFTILLLTDLIISCAYWWAIKIISAGFRSIIMIWDWSMQNRVAKHIWISFHRLLMALPSTNTIIHIFEMNSITFENKRRRWPGNRKSWAGLPVCQPQLKLLACCAASVSYTYRTTQVRLTSVQRYSVISLSASLNMIRNSKNGISDFQHSCLHKNISPKNRNSNRLHSIAIMNNLEEKKYCLCQEWRKKLHENIDIDSVVREIIIRLNKNVKDTLIGLRLNAVRQSHHGVAPGVPCSFVVRKNRNHRMILLSQKHIARWIYF